MPAEPIPRPMPMARKLTLLILTGALFALTANIMENWWANRDNNLFNNGRWIIGKDTGKFLFYTYDFMFEPLKDNRVKLNSHMGFQELLFHKPETGDRRLKKLSFDMEAGGGTYIWVFLRKQGQRAFACRFSYRKNFPAGFFTFDDQGKMVEHAPFQNGMPKLEKSRKQSVELELAGNRWTVKIDGKEAGWAPDPEYKNGFFGFRGSGTVRQNNNLRAIEIEWLDKGEPATERENFTAPATTSDQWRIILSCALVFIVLRLLRSLSMGGCLPPPAARLYLDTDIALAASVMAAATLFTGLSWAARLGLSLALPDIFSFAAFTWLIRKNGLNAKIPAAAMAVFIITASALAGLSLHRQGEWAWRKQYPAITAKTGSYPNAFIRYPDPKPGRSEILRTEPFTIAYGLPFTTGDDPFRQQEIELDFIMPPDTTLDIAFQQQSFLTRGDPQGEPLPLQRRLIRLSTVEHVSGGIATQTGRQPEPFIPLLGSLLPGELNTLRIRSGDEGLRVALNDRENPLAPAMTPLGYGETILMTHEQPVPVQRLAIRAANNQATAQRLWPLLGLLIVPLTALGGGLLFRIMGSTTPRLACAGAIATSFPLLAYLAAILFVDPVRLSLTAVDRLTLQDFALAASAWSLLYWIPLHLKRIKRPALAANLFFTLFLGTVAFLIWDIYLPPEHILKTRFAPTRTAPGQMISSDKMKAPWYASNERIGGSIFVWRQQFEGRWLPLAKAPGTLRGFVLGGSQAWGSGAASTGETFSGLLDKRCREAGQPVRIINAGVNGAGIAGVRDVFFGALLNYAPDIVILDIGLNDTADLAGKKDVSNRLALFEEVSAACKTRGIDMILVHEPMSPESPYKPHKQLYEGFADIARKYGFLVVDANTVFAGADAMEITWWDAAHMAPRGHILMADAIFPALEAVVKKRMDAPPLN